MEDLMMILIGVFGIALVIGIFMSRRNRTTGSSNSANRPKTGNAKLAEDIKATQTSRIVDAIDILKSLDETKAGYRHYCELIGTSQSESNVTAPYSKRQVAYYDLRAFRVENIGGQETETLIAHEKSIEPFYMVDGSSADGKVYIDLDTFGKNVILVNSANRIEGPGSDFARAMDANINGSATAPRDAMAIVGDLKDKARDVVDFVRTRTPHVSVPQLSPALAYAGATPSSMVRTEAFIPAAQLNARTAKDNFAFGHGPGGHGPGGPGFGGPGFGAPSGFGFGPGGMPGNMGDFMGGADWNNIGGPHGGHWNGNNSNNAGEVLLGMGLGALLGSMAAASASEASRTPVTPQSQFRGYRIVEDVVPLNSQVYALGEIYRNGDSVFMSKSVSKTYPSSYFATKPEAEVLHHLNA